MNAAYFPGGNRSLPNRQRRDAIPVDLGEWEEAECEKEGPGERGLLLGDSMLDIAQASERIATLQSTWQPDLVAPVSAFEFQLVMRC